VALKKTVVKKAVKKPVKPEAGTEPTVGKKKVKIVKKKKAPTPAPEVRTAEASIEVPVHLTHTEVFNVNRKTEVEQRTVPVNHIQVLVAGNDLGLMDVTGKTVKDFAVQLCQHRGIRSFTVYLDGTKVDDSFALHQLASYSKIEIVPKDQRG